MRKAFWWFLLASCSGTALFIVILSKTIHDGSIPLSAWLWFTGDVAASALSIFMLRKCYYEKPLRGTGLWQLSLSDSIVCTIVPALSLTLIGWIARRILLPWEIALIAVILGAGYLAMLMLVVRMGYAKQAHERWIGALGMLIFGLLVTVLGVILQFLIIDLVI